MVLSVISQCFQGARCDISRSIGAFPNLKGQHEYPDMCACTLDPTLTYEFMKPRNTATEICEMTLHYAIRESDCDSLPGPNICT